MHDPDLECDLVLKGGITSGVVYPRAIVELSHRYRFKNVGGTSAGAIAAIVTAAAEYGRASGGFDRIAELPGELSKTLIDKFQPHPKLRPLFAVLLASLSGKRMAILRSLVVQYFRPGFAWAIPGFALTAIWHLVQPSIAAILLGLLVAILGFAAGICRAVYAQVAGDLPDHDFGICGGLTPEDRLNGPPALTNWLTELIDRVAGHPVDSDPLGVADLAARGISVKTVTTDISTHRPYALPMDNNLHFFSEAEFRRVFPDRVVKAMIDSSARVEGTSRDLYYFNVPNLPLVVLVRMSLSFPGLISSVPLWRRDFTLIKSTPEEQFQRCLFSDGGLSSNFPVSFFDAFLPHRPTFGISLGDHDPRREGARVAFPMSARQGQLIPVQQVSGLFGFLGALLNSAKDWQDTLQSVLPGYRERIVNVSLEDSEGGLNLNMPGEVIDTLSIYGAQAGKTIISEFNLDEHRWRRYLVEVRALDDALRQFAEAYDHPARPNSLSYPQLAVGYQPDSYAGLTQGQRSILRARADGLAELGRQFLAAPSLVEMAEKLPASRSKVRIVARMED